MIIFFHFIFLISKCLVTTLSKSFSADRNLSDSEPNCSEIDENTINYYQESIGSECNFINGQVKFNPPSYIQRYEAVCSILQQRPWKEKLKKVVDFGCAELGFFLYLKHIPGLEEILEVDIDENVLERVVSKAAPLNSDFLFCKRKKPLNVFIMSGSIADYDKRLAGTDAVVAIELIEHLYPEVLDKVPWNIFHEIKPKIAVFTTPNADFNALFSNKIGLRHPDHKFEWSRKEFYNWTLKITTEYPNYSVKFYGIGMGPEGSENLGCCTQMAVFIKNEDFQDEKPNLEPIESNSYKLIRKYEYPYYVDKRTDEEKILDEVIYRVKFTMNDANYYNYEDYTTEIPLSDLMDYISEWCNSEEELKKILVDHGFYVKERDGCSTLIYSGIPKSSYGDEEESSFDYDFSEYFPKAELAPENWDLECGDGNFNDPSDKFPPEELTSFLSARSQEETENTKLRLEKELLLGSGKTDFKPQPEECPKKVSSLARSKSSSMSKIPKRTIIGNSRKSQSRNLGMKTHSANEGFGPG